MPALNPDVDTLALYKFDETSVPGTGYATAVDSIATGGTARNLTETNGGAGARSPNYTHLINAGGIAGRLARWFPGKATTAAAFLSRAGDASSTAVLVGSYTIRFWVRADVLASEIFAYTGPTESSADNCLFQLTVLGTGLLSIFWEQGAGANVTVNQTTGSGLVAGTWAHVAITVDNSGGTSTVKFYLNGTLQQTVTGATKANGGGSATWFMGCSGTSPAASFRGAVTGFCIDSVVRTGVEIAAYAALTNYTHPTDGSTFVAWHFQDQPDAFDSAPYGYHLRKVGTGAIEIVDPLVIGAVSGKARHCDGTVEYIGHFGYTTFLNGIIGDNTLEFWSRLDAGYAANQTGFAIYGESVTELQVDNHFAWDLLTSRVLRLTYENGVGVDVIFSTASPIFAALADGYNRHFIAITKYNSGGANRTMEVYIDGTLFTTVTTTGDMDGGGNDYLRVPVGSGATPHPIPGTFDEMRWQKRRLSAAEILADYQSNAPVVAVVTPTPGSTIATTDTITANFADADLDLGTYTPIFGVELAWNGTSHTAGFSLSSRSVLGTGFQHVFRRNAGWLPGTLTLSGNATDAGGHVVPFSFSWTVDGTIGLPPVPAIPLRQGGLLFELD